MTREGLCILEILDRNGQLSIAEIVSKSKSKLDFITTSAYLTYLCKRQLVIKLANNKYDITNSGKLFSINSNPHKDLIDDAKVKIIKAIIAFIFFVISIITAYKLFN